MRADKFLAEYGYYESRAKARAAIEAGLVHVDGKAITKPSGKISRHVGIEAAQLHPWVSRGGVKLEFALSEFAVSAKSRTCLDVGAATGGFTQVLKVNGASHVYAVDVGTDQLHPSLRNDPKITSMQQTDARNLKAEDFKVSPELIVCDVCFISCMKALAVPLSLAAPKAALITLVKPQFEVGRKGIGKGGLVRSHKDAIAAVDRVKNCLISKGWTIKGNAQSPIKGGSGNTEYLLHAKR